MNDTARKVVLAALVDALHDRGSWCGETHIQKNAYFLEELLGVPLEYEFILYKHGPFSFELRDELSGMRADGILDLEPRPHPYGPSLVTTDLAQTIEERFPKTLVKYRPAVEFVTERLGAKGVVDLEQLSTALFVTREMGKEASAEERAQRLTALKPHIDTASSENAIETVDAIITEASPLVFD